MSAGSTVRRVAALVSASAGGFVLLAGGVASADPVSFTSTCNVYEYPLLPQADTQINSNVTVTAPATVAPGAQVTYRVQPGSMTVPTAGHSFRSVGSWTRMKYDLDIPAGTTFVGAQVVAGTGSNVSGTPSVTQVDDNGNPSSTGAHLRISGANQTADSDNGGANGPNASKNSSGGLTANAGATFQLPAVDVTVTAGAAGTKIVPMLRVTDGNSGAYNSPKNYFTFLQYETLAPGYWERENCSPRNNSSAALNAGGQGLATIDVVASDAQTATTVTAAATAATGAAVPLSASVAPAPTGGTVQFMDGSAAIGAPVTVGADGKASLSQSFTTAGAHQITAVYSGAAGFTGSTSPAVTVTVSGSTGGTGGGTGGTGGTGGAGGTGSAGLSLPFGSSK